MYPVYYPVSGDTLPVFFHSFDGVGGSVTLTGLAVTDIEIFKDGGTTARSSDAGYTLLDTDGIDFGGLTGIHGFSIDLSDDTDSGFYEEGPWYHVVVSAVTIDSQTVRFVACAFRIQSATRGMAGTALPAAAADAAGGLPISDAGGLDLDTLLGHLTAAVATATALATAQADLDTLTGSDGATLASAQGNYAPAKAGDEMDLVDAPNATAVTAIQSGLGTATELAKVPKSDGTSSWNATALAAIQSEANDALVAQKLDHLVAAAESDDPADNSIIAKLAAGDGNWSTFAASTDALQALRDHIGDGTNLTEAGGDGDHLTEAGGDGDHLTEAGADGDHLTEAGGTGDHLLAVPYNAAWDAEIQSEANDALVALGLDHLLAASVAGADVTDNSIVAKLVSKESTADWDDFDNTTDALEALRDHIGDGTSLTEAGGDGDHLTEAGGDGDHLTEAGGDGDHLTEAGDDGDHLTEAGGDGDHLTESGGTGDQLTALATAAALTTHDGKLDTVDGVVDDIKVITDALTAAAAAKLAASATGIVTGTVDTGSFAATTTQFEADDITEATADHYIGRIIIFITGALAGQATDITDYALSGANGHFTVTALTEAPGNDDTFVIV